MTKEKILQEFSDINHVYNNCTRYDTLKHMLDELTEQKTGHWIKSRDSYGNNHFTCPFCEHDIATKYAGTWEDNYCANCGARLESEGEK